MAVESVYVEPNCKARTVETLPMTLFTYPSELRKEMLVTIV